ncbi:MAG: hypothetical protein ACK5DN_14230, partial [Hyphomonadaceae bacterium]
MGWSLTLLTLVQAAAKQPQLALWRPMTGAILGAVMMGWSLTLLTLVQTAVTQPHLSLWRPMTGSILVWWVVDSSISVGLNTPGNAISNTGFLLLYLIPVLASGVLKRQGPA